MDVMLAALLVGCAIFISVISGLYCLSQDIERIVEQAVEKVIEATNKEGNE